MEKKGFENDWPLESSLWLKTIAITNPVSEAADLLGHP